MVKLFLDGGEFQQGADPGEAEFRGIPVREESGTVVTRSPDATLRFSNAVGAPIQNNNAIFNTSGFSWFPMAAIGLPTDYSMGVYAVPEPSSLVILGIGGGLLGLNLVRRRRAK